MGGCCAKCGYNKCPDVLEFHHLDESTKDFDWGKLRLRSKETILTELDKCTMLCANCHRETHYELNRKN